MTFIISLGITIYEEKGAKQMAKYKVIKSFPSSDAGYNHLVGEMYEPTKSHTRTQNLLRLGYIEEIPESLKTVWDLKEGDECWIRASTISSLTGPSPVLPMLDIWHDDVRMRSLRDIGGIFLTYDDCKKSMERDRCREILIRDTKGFKPNWDGEHYYYEVAYDYEGKKFYIDSIIDLPTHADLWFPTEEDAEASAKNHRNEWLTWLGVEKYKPSFVEVIDDD